MSQEQLTALGIKKFTIPSLENKHHWYNSEAQVSAYSLDDLKDKMRAYYAGIINKELNFFELKSKP